MQFLREENMLVTQLNEARQETDFMERCLTKVSQPLFQSITCVSINYAGYGPIFLNGPWLCHIFGPAPLNPRTMQVWPMGSAGCPQPALGLICVTLTKLY